MAVVRRILELELERFLDKELSGNSFAKMAIEKKLPRLLMVEAAKQCVGFKEATGRNDGKMIKLVQETVGGASGEPYCAGGMMTLIAYAEKKTELVSPVPATELAQNIWWQTPVEMRVKRIPLPGAIAVWADYNSKGQRKYTGHCEVVLSADEDGFQCVGFNTSGTTKPGQTVNRDGNGVYYTVRSYKNTVSRRLLGFIKPF